MLPTAVTSQHKSRVKVYNNKKGKLTMQIRSKKDIRDLLMKRDHMSKQEATLVINTTQQLINEAMEECHFDKVEEILADYLGLEPDYIYIFF